MSTNAMNLLLQLQKYIVVKSANILKVATLFQLLLMAVLIAHLLRLK